MLHQTDRRFHRRCGARFITPDKKLQALAQNEDLRIAQDTAI
jgi:hypothetical protein